MWLLILEATAAFFIFAFIIWWTMFHGREPEYTKQPTKPLAKAPLDKKPDSAEQDKSGKPG